MSACEMWLGDNIKIPTFGVSFISYYLQTWQHEVRVLFIKKN